MSHQQTSNVSDGIGITTKCYRCGDSVETASPPGVHQGVGGGEEFCEFSEFIVSNVECMMAPSQV